MQSKIYLKEEVKNKDRQFGGSPVYYPAFIYDRKEAKAPALFTKSQIREALLRAQKNPEDMPKKQTFWEWLTTWPK
jgi:hypothetical protein